MKDLLQLVRLRGLGYVVAFLSRDVISVSRVVATGGQCTYHAYYATTGTAC